MLHYLNIVPNYTSLIVGAAPEKANPYASRQAICRYS